MTDPIPHESQSRARVSGGGFPLWLAVAILAPLGLLFLVSLAVAAVGGLLWMMVLPRFFRLRRPKRRNNWDCIELDPSEYKHIESQSMPPGERR